jgi:hypothetical protein
MRLTKTEMFTMLSIVAPYIFALFFFRHTDAFTFLGLIGFCALFIIGCLTILLLTKQTKFRKIYYFIATAISVTIFLTCRDGLINTADKIFFSIHKTRMAETVVAIEKARRDNKQIEIPQLNFAAVDTLESGEIIFTLDGMLDNCVGIAYSKDNENPGYTNCGRIIEWKKLDDHWYLWYTT